MNVDDEKEDTCSYCGETSDDCRCCPDCGNEAEYCYCNDDDGEDNEC